MHTPGPWFAFDASELAGDEPGKRAFFVGLREFCTIAYVRAGSDEALATGDIEANARLIAAAPDLYEALRFFRAAINVGRPDMVSVAMLKAESALSKLSQQQGSDATGSPHVRGQQNEGAES